MLFTVKPLPFSTHWQGRVFYTAKSITFSMKIDPKITREPCRKKYNFYFYVTNVFFDAGERGECMETFLGLCRLEKPPKIALHFSKSITIGISIQMGICSSLISVLASLRNLHGKWPTAKSIYSQKLCLKYDSVICGLRAFAGPRSLRCTPLERPMPSIRRLSPIIWDWPAGSKCC